MGVYGYCFDSDLNKENVRFAWELRHRQHAVKAKENPPRRVFNKWLQACSKQFGYREAAEVGADAAGTGETGVTGLA